MKVLLIINPVAGDTDKKPFLEDVKELCEKYGIELEIFKTTGENDHSKLQDKLESFQPDKVAVAGGDGTMLLAALVLRETDYPMGIIPLGSANGMARELNISNEPMQAFQDILLSNLTTKLDLIKVNDEHFALHIGDVGSNAEIVDRYENDPNRGMSVYAKYFFDELLNAEPFEVKIKANGKTTEKTAVMVALCNARTYGTGIPLNIEGSPTDGKLEIVIIEKVDINSLIKAGLSKFDEKFMKENDFTIISCKEAEIELQPTKKLQLDGEVIGEFSKLKVEIVPAAIQLIHHKEMKYNWRNNSPILSLVSFSLEMKNLYNKGKFRYGEWAKHLRPYLKAKGNKRWRRFAKVQIEKQLEDKAALHKPRKRNKKKKLIKVRLIYKNGDFKHKEIRRYRTIRDAQNAMNRPYVAEAEILNQ